MKRKLKKRKKPSPQERELLKQQKAYEKEVKTVFQNAGFLKIPGLSNKEIEFEGRRGDIDDLFLFENIAIICEYTCTKDVGDHLLKKKVLFDKIVENKIGFLQYLEGKFSTFASSRNSAFDLTQFKVFILYCSKNLPDETHKKHLPAVHFFDYPILKYFLGVSKAILRSSRYELFAFLGLNFKDIGEEIFHSSRSAGMKYDGMILPEPNSKFEHGYKVISFYLPPEDLLRHAYILRKDSWRDTEWLYQRIVDKKKINSMRSYLSKEGRVFVNNIIVTLPSNTRIVDDAGNTVDPEKCTTTKAVVVEIPKELNNIGIVDGQHRIFAYHEGLDDALERVIANYRKQQTLLVTGIVYPEAIDERQRLRFEAKLFLEINSNQSGAKADLKQSIELILYPFSTIAISKTIILRLAKKGVLSGLIEQYFYEKDKIKTTSIVSYGIKPLVKFSGTDSLFVDWSDPAKSDLLAGRNETVCSSYEDYCSEQINLFLSAAKENLSSTAWSLDKKKGGVLTPTFINGFLRCLRSLVENKKTGDLEYYKVKMKKLNEFKFGDYTSSQWNAMGQKLYEDYFN